MVKNKKALILFFVFLAFFNSPAYPKGKSIKYLPSSQDVETASKDYSSSPRVVSELECSACKDKDRLVDECERCVDLKTACPNECLTTNPPSTQKVIRCSSDDKSADYNCTGAPFDVDACPQTECDYVDSNTSTNCSSRLKDDSTNCESSAYLECSGFSVDSTTSPYGLQRRGCPDADSDELVPSGCSSCDVSGSGKDREWTCPATSTCTASSGPSFVEPCSGYGRCDSYSSYYDVKYVWEDNAKSCSHSCSSCSGSECDPASPAAECNTDGRSSCSSKSCSKTETCYYGNSCAPCNNVCTSCCPPYPPPPTGWKGKWPPCSPSVAIVCSPCSCNDSVYCEKKASVKSYIFSLNSTFKGCIDTCTDYANAYEECQDRVACCNRLLCGDEDTDCCPIDSCTKRVTETNECYSYTDGDCAMFEQDASNCLKGRTDECFKQIDADTDINHDFVARTGEAYNITWQISTNPVDDAKDDEDAKFYTMVKVWDPTFKKVVYNSMMHQKSLNAAFSIYGSTLVPKNTLLPGKEYQVQLHYFMHDRDSTEPDYRVEIKYISLTIVRVRE